MQHSQTILEYSPPRIFFGGEHRWRTHGVALSATVLLIVGSLFACIGLLSSKGTDSRWIFFIVMGTAPLGLALYLIRRWIRDEKTTVRITADGIDVGKRHWSWSRISELGAYRQDYGIQIYFEYITRRGYMSRSNRPVTTSRRGSLFVTPTLRKDAYQMLVKEIAPYLAEHFPRVKVISELQKPAEHFGS